MVVEMELVAMHPGRVAHQHSLRRCWEVVSAASRLDAYHCLDMKLLI